MGLDTRLKLFLTLAGVFMTCLLVGDIIGGKPVPLAFSIAGKPQVISVGMIAFPITFLLTG